MTLYDTLLRAGRPVLGRWHHLIFTVILGMLFLSTVPLISTTPLTPQFILVLAAIVLSLWLMIYPGGMFDLHKVESLHYQMRGILAEATPNAAALAAAGEFAKLDQARPMNTCRAVATAIRLALIEYTAQNSAPAGLTGSAQARPS